MKIGNLWVDMFLVILAMVTIWLGVSSVSGRLFLKKKFWVHEAKVWLRAITVVLVGQGLVYRAFLIEPAYLTYYNWAALIGTLAYLLLVRDSALDDEAKEVLKN